jgi:poly(3-hydroxybutyrate) depolymerase
MNQQARCLEEGILNTFAVGATLAEAFGQADLMDDAGVDLARPVLARCRVCQAQPVDVGSVGLTVTRAAYGLGKEGAEVVLYTIADGGHTWPGQPPVIWFIGKSTMAISWPTT